MPDRYIVSYDHILKFFIEYMNTFDGFVPITQHELSSIDFDKNNEIYVVQRGTWLPDFVFKPTTKISLVNTEQLCDVNVEKRVYGEINELEKRCGYKVTVYDYSQTNCDILIKGGFMAVHRPYLSLPQEHEYLKSLKKEKPIFDIGFVGAHNKRRLFILNELKSKGINVLLVDKFGKERDEQLAQCKFILNIHWEDHFTIFESIRCNRWLQAGFSVITEESVDKFDSPLLLTYSYDSLVNSISDLVK